jgi:hypothetical protein
MGVLGGLMRQLLSPRGKFDDHLGGHMVVDLMI